MAVTEFLWDPVTDCVVQERDGTGAITAKYAYEPEPYGRLSSETRGGETRYYHADALGTTRLMTDETGQVTDTFEYSAWGEETSRTGTNPTPYRWVGKVGYSYHASIGAYHIRDRIYNARQSAWASVDPDLTQRLKGPYLYCSNRPVIGIDPSGRDWGIPALHDSKGIITGRFDLGCKTSKCCKPTNNSGLPRWFTEFIIEPRHRPSAFFFQQVSSRIDFIYGTAPTNGDYAGRCNVPRCDCPELQIYLEEQFVEIFSPWKTPSLSVSDTHGVGPIGDLFAAVSSMCKHKASNCCSWYFSKATRKRLQCVDNFRGLPIDMNYRGPNSFTIKGRSCECGFNQRWNFSMSKWTYPSGNTKWPDNTLGITLPVGTTVNPVIGALAEREDYIQITYEQGNNYIEWFRASNGYRRV